MKLPSGEGIAVFICLQCHELCIQGKLLHCGVLFTVCSSESHPCCSQNDGKDQLLPDFFINKGSSASRTVCIKPQLLRVCE